MKIIPLKTIRLGRLVISVSGYEIVFIYTSAKAIYVKTIRKGMISMPLKCAAGAAIAAFVIISGTLFFHSSPQEEALENISEDDRLKNELLMSAETDFTLPDEKSSLQIHRHKVKKGETLGNIASKYGVSIDTICGSNGLRTYEPVAQGKMLNIPNKDGILYTMRSGSSLVNVAKQYRVSLEKILVENSLRNADFIKTGTKLFIPDAKPNNIIRGFIWPTSGRAITCGYGWRPNPFSGSGREFHSGMDIRANYEQVKAVMYGKITFAGWLGGYGKAVIIAHPDGWKTLYAHLSRINVKSGQYVKQGQIIAKSGNTGRSTGPHLHLEVIKNGKHLDPRTKLK